MACREDIRKKILDEVDKVFIEGRYTYYRVNDDTFRVANAKETRGKSKANSLNQAREIATEVKDRIIAKYGNNVFVEVILPKYIGFPVEIKVTPSDLYIERLFANIPNEKRTETVSRLAFLQDPALYQQELMEDSPLKMIPYEAWLAQNEAPNPIVDEEGVAMFSPITSENLIPTAFQAEQLTLEFPTVIKPGVPELFESTPELASIGTPQQYSQYLDTIFPNSKVKDIVYHGSSSKIEVFDNKKFTDSFKDNPFLTKEEIDSIESSSEGYYFTSEKKVALTYGHIIHNVMLNVENLKTVEGEGNNWDSIVDVEASIEVGETFTNSTRGFFQQQRINDKSSNKGIIFKDIIDQGSKGNSEDINTSNIIAVHTSEQIHILGSKQDIESFKEFIKAKPVVTSVTQIPDVIATMIYQNNNCK